jgi:phosphotransferase system HPr (HPr) family protein
LGNRLADARSILHVIILSASLGAAIEVEAEGVDEQEAIRAVEDFFEQEGAPSDSGGESVAEQT